MRTIEVKNMEIENFEEFFEGFKTDTVLGAEYDGEKKLLKVFLEDDSLISEGDIYEYLEKPRVKLVFTKKTLSEELKEKFSKDIPVLVDTPNRIEVLVDEADKEAVTQFIKERKKGFNEEV